MLIDRNLEIFDGRGETIVVLRALQAFVLDERLDNLPDEEGIAARALVERITAYRSD